MKSRGWDPHLRLLFGAPGKYFESGLNNVSLNCTLHVNNLSA